MEERTHTDGSRFTASPATHEEYADYIDLTPTDEGFAQVAARFAFEISRDVRANRREADALLLTNLIEIVFYLGHEAGKAGATVGADPAPLIALRDQIKDAIR